MQVSRHLKWPVVKAQAEGRSAWGFKSLAVRELWAELLERPAVFIDTETTGLSSEDRIIEVAAIKGDEAWVGQFNPGCYIGLGSMAVHGISQADVENKPPFADKALDLMNFMDGCVLVGQGMAFDARMLAMEFARTAAGVGKDDERKRVFTRFVSTPWFCTKRLGPLVGQKATLRLEQLADAFGVEFERESHSALRDALVLRDILAAAREKS